MAKIELVAAGLQLSIEGDEAWVAKQFDAAAAKLPDLAALAASIPKPTTETNDANGGENGPVSSLASHIKEHGGEKSQPRRFLATADWLRRKGEKGLKTAKVSAALKENQQKKLANPAQCLNDNVSQGFCEKDSQGFFITPEGLKELGYKF